MNGTGSAPPWLFASWRGGPGGSPAEERGGGGNSPRGGPAPAPPWLLPRGGGVPVGLPDEEDREEKTRGGNSDPQVEGSGAQPIGGCDIPRRQRRQGYREIAGELVEPHRQAPPPA